MGRKRVIDTDELYFKAELVKMLGARGLHLYIRLWSIADDWGGYEPNYADLALKMGALRYTGKQVRLYIERLVEAKKIIPYEVNGITYHWLKNLLERQPLKNPSLPTIPLPDWITYQVKRYQSGKAYAEYTVNSEKLPVGYQYTTGNTETKRNERKRKEKKGKEKKPSSQESPTWLDKFLEYVNAENLPEKFDPKKSPYDALVLFARCHLVAYKEPPSIQKGKHMDIMSRLVKIYKGVLPDKIKQFFTNHTVEWADHKTLEVFNTEVAKVGLSKPGSPLDGGRSPDDYDGVRPKQRQSTQEAEDE